MTEFEPFNLGRYEVTEVLGRGAMGVVYKGTDTALNRIVAVKTIDFAEVPDTLSKEETLGIFLREARIAGALSHPNITSIYDIGQEGESHYFVMEYVEGFTIEQLIQDRAHFSLLMKLRIITAIARALHYAHKRGVIHRDIKPANIMIVESNDPKIMDFGVARLAEGPMPEDVEKSRIFGTPQYMSPEQIKGKPLDHKTDIFSLGATAYEFLTSEKPFKGASLKELLTSIVKTDQAAIHGIDETLPWELNDIIVSSLRKDSEARFRTASQFADAIEILIDKMESAAAPKPPKEIGIEKQRIVKALKKNYLFFSDFDEKQIVEIFKLSAKVRLGAGEVVFEEGALGDKMYLIIEGEVKIVQKNSKGEEVVINTLRDGDCFGEMAIIDNSPRSATARTVEETVVVAINEIVLRVTRPELCLKLYKNLASVVADKLRRTDRILNDLIGEDTSGLGA